MNTDREGWAFRVRETKVGRGWVGRIKAYHKNLSTRARRARFAQNGPALCLVKAF